MRVISYLWLAGRNLVMRILVVLITIFGSSVCWGEPITYYFDGYTNNIITNTGSHHDPSRPLESENGSIITNGNIDVSGHIIFDPDRIRSGYGNPERGTILAWGFSTQGLLYSGEDNILNYINFTAQTLDFLDEVPSGGHGPDVVLIHLGFTGAPFSNGPSHFPVDAFSGGKFSTALESGKVNDELTVIGLNGVISSLWRAPISVNEPSVIALILFGFAFIGLSRHLRFGNRESHRI